MTLADLTDPETIALVGLARMMVRADRAFTREEAGVLDTLAAEVGDEAFWRAAEQAAEHDDDAIKTFARDVTRQEARELIYGALYQVATAGTIDDGESDLLDWLAAEWSVSAVIDPPGDGPYRT